ncbi:hypothetical protein PhCBS80983_g02644 [Powellomyces hirtus]|uniref:Extracellular membrane protein CFEM domain-containing protein n=1 Tax=Powellomyces hirtus TaxID=109895 RepID=A0A507E524_9FUNG|nr:hypothetical protein PhCBS80983_g02644 [Powellomyces hirtus]
MYFTTVQVVALALAAAGVQAQGTATAGLTTLCKTFPNTPACELFAACTTQTSVPTCNADSLLASACADPFTATDAACATKNAAAVPVPAILTARNASSDVANICSGSMASMAGCQGTFVCPARNPATGVSDCKALTSLTSLCKDMPEMPECKNYLAFCAVNAMVEPFCHDDKDGHSHSHGAATPAPAAASPASAPGATAPSGAQITAVGSTLAAAAGLGLTMLLATL